MRSTLLCSVGALALVSSAAVAQAQESAGATAQPQDTSGQIGDIIVTAQRVSESLQTTPVAVSAVTGEALDRKQISNVTQIQYTIPTLQIATAKDGDSSSANIGLRGQIQTYSSITVDPSVGLYVDGIYVARNAGAALDLLDLERVEVLRGPQGTLFGRNTTGGAINLIANKPVYELTGSVRASYGNYDAVNGQIVLNAPLVDDQLAVRVAYQHNQRDGYGRSLYTGQSLADQNVDFFRAQLLIEPGAGPLKILLSADGSWSENNGSLQHTYYVSPTGLAPAVVAACAANSARVGCPAGSPPLVDASDGFYTSRAGLLGYNKSRTLGFGGTIEYDLGGATFKSITSYRELQRTYHQDLDGTSYSLLDTYRGYIDQDQVSQELQLLGKAFGDRLSWIVGAFYFREKGQDLTDSNSLAPVSPTRAVKDVYARNTSKAGYGQLTYEIVDGVRLTGGLRYTDDVRRMRKRAPTLNMATGATGCALRSGLTAPCEFEGKASFNYWSYTAGVDWQASRNAFVYAKVTKGYRAGGLNQGGVDTVSLAPFDPESVQSFEVGAKLDLFDRRLRINADYFYGNYDNVQRATVRVINNLSSNFVVNAAKARIQGIEAEIVAKPFKPLTLSGSFGWIDPKYKEFIDIYSGLDRSAEPFPQSPKYTAGGAADFVIPASFGSVTLHSDYSWRSAQYYEATQVSRVGAYGLWNAQVSVQLNDPDLQLSVWGRNLTKVRYYQSVTDVSSTVLGYATANPGEPRMYGVTGTYRF
ncbi:TonB-dependent receptor [Novosphingobium resinovorum]|uniref:TonB-dependent receptor n=1 Tax=Novosphingobium resinovorum TaxID=158500 RepID=UPI000ABF8673|nr:TonB-dependent receptor [Novosphingobium resinovorum]